MRGGPERVVLREGAAARLICLPFAGGSARSFVRLARHLPDGWQVTAAQPPSGAPDGLGLDDLAGHYLAVLAGDLAAARRFEGPTLLLGHSLGAAVAHRMAALWPADVADAVGVVLSAPPPPGTVTAGLLALDDPALLTEAGRRGMLPELGGGPDFAIRFLLPELRRDLVALGGAGWRAEPVAAEVHVLAGTQDALLPPAAAARLADALGARSCRLVEGGHLYVVEQPAAAARAVDALAHGRRAAFPSPDSTTSVPVRDEEYA
ncbi:thioesterase domain-containing protein [Streptomyces sp. NPDC006552]|uniref:thioesterase II family protein n=1 Tax=Streptomyces sp. NPDC006552 TaxID=3157179 RepID=UPI0033BCA5B3